MNYIKELRPLIIFSKGTFYATGEYYGSYDDGQFEEFELDTFSRIPEKLHDDFHSIIENVLEEILSDQGYTYCYEEGGNGYFKIWYDGKLHWKIDHVHKYIEEKEVKIEGDYNEPCSPCFK